MDTSQFIPKFYTMNPETEELLPTGGYLMNGMVVLIEDPAERVSRRGMTTPGGFDRAKVANRWCTISELSYNDPGVRPGGRSVSFTATYEDGMMRRRTILIYHSWLVRRDSISAATNADTKRFEEVSAIVASAIREFYVSIEEKVFPDVDFIANKAANRITSTV